MLTAEDRLDYEIYIYQKTFGLSEKQVLSETADRFNLNLEFLQLENEKTEKDHKKKK